MRKYISMGTKLGYKFNYNIRLQIYLILFYWILILSKLYIFFLYSQYLQNLKKNKKSIYIYMSLIKCVNYKFFIF